MADVPISAHAHGADIITANVEAGFDSIEHGSDLTDETVELMADRGTFLVPTLSSFQNFTEVAARFGIPDDRVEEARFVVERQREGFQRAFNAGVKIAAGNDAGFQFLPHGESIVRELELYVELGMTPLDAIRSATNLAAHLLRLDDKLGSLEVGKVADVLVVRGDAGRHVGALRDVQLVVKEGQIVRDTREAASPKEG
jgi:imidazolonepropionase-like amidohydrolase